MRLQRFLLPCLLGVIGTANAQSSGQAGLVGSTARRIVLDGLDGESVKLPDTSPSTRLTVLVFWATWSRFSKAELAHLSARYKSWAGSGVSVIAVNVEAHRVAKAERERVRAWLSKSPLPFPVAVDDGLHAFNAYGVVAVPTTLIIDANRMIVMRLPGYPVASDERIARFIHQRLNAETQDRTQSPIVRHAASYKRAVRHLHLGRQLVKRQEVELAEYTLRLAIKEDPGLLDAHLALARLLDSQGKKAPSEEALREAQKKFPTSARLLLYRAQRAHDAEKHKTAEELLGAALKENPALPGALTLRGRIALAERDPARALSAFEAAMQINPFDFEPVLAAARLYEKRGDKQRSLTLYERAYELLTFRSSATRVRAMRKDQTNDQKRGL